MSQHNKQGTGDRDLPPPERRNARFEQEVADSRDHDQQSGKNREQKMPVKTPDVVPKNS
ncbi:MAG: hypothetical protein ABI870_09755 [Rhodanobacter sp.]